MALIILPEKNKPESKHGVDKIACFIYETEAYIIVETSTGYQYLISM